MTDKTLKNCIWRYRQRSKEAVGSENRCDARSDSLTAVRFGGVSRAEREKDGRYKLDSTNESCV